MDEEKLTFEEAFAKLEENVAALRSGGLSLEDSVTAYENCGKYHRLCTEILAGVRQKIEIYNPQSGKTETFDV